MAKHTRSNKNPQSSVSPLTKEVQPRPPDPDRSPPKDVRDQNEPSGSSSTLNVVSENLGDESEEIGTSLAPTVVSKLLDFQGNNPSSEATDIRGRKEPSRESRSWSIESDRRSKTLSDADVEETPRQERRSGRDTPPARGPEYLRTLGQVDYEHDLDSIHMKLPVRRMCYAQGPSLSTDIANSFGSRMNHPNVDKGKRQETNPLGPKSPERKDNSSLLNLIRGMRKDHSRFEDEIKKAADDAAELFSRYSHHKARSATFAKHFHDIENEILRGDGIFDEAVEEEIAVPPSQGARWAAPKQVAPVFQQVEEEDEESDEDSSPEAEAPHSLRRGVSVISRPHVSLSAKGRHGVSVPRTVATVRSATPGSTPYQNSALGRYMSLIHE